MQIAPHVEVLGISYWKRWQIDQFLRPRCHHLHYSRSMEAALARQAVHRGAIAVWAARESAELAPRAAALGAPLWRMEDGFLRSVGLGSNHVGGASLVLDDEGIYFDPRTPSRLEHLLQTADFSPGLIQRAANLRQQLIASGLTKYNVGAIRPPTLGGGGRRRHLVIGQVENDASIRFGAAAIRSNLALLKAVRESDPQSWIIYKPHPDVEAGTRAGRLEDAVTLQFADEIVRGVSAVALFTCCDSVHVITSLAGFEALLRGVPVVTWGQPFYAGWGLTEDRAPLARRTQKLSVEELVAATLIEYPLYVNPVDGRPCEVEEVVAQLSARTAATADREASWLRRSLRLSVGAMRSIGSSRHG